MSFSASETIITAGWAPRLEPSSSASKTDKLLTTLKRIKDVTARALAGMAAITLWIATIVSSPLLFVVGAAVTGASCLINLFLVLPFAQDDECLMLKIFGWPIYLALLCSDVLAGVFNRTAANLWDYAFSESEEEIAAGHENFPANEGVQETEIPDLLGKKEIWADETGKTLEENPLHGENPADNVLYSCGYDYWRKLIE